MPSLYLDSETHKISSIFTAVETGDLNAAERLVEEYGENFRNVRCKGYRILYNAVASGKLDVARFLLDRGAAVNNDGENRSLSFYVPEQTLLQWALLSEDIELFKIILTRGSNVNDYGGRDRDTALHTAVQLNQLEAVKLLLEHKSDIDSVDDYKRTPLHASIEAGTDSLPMLQLLFKYNPNLSVEMQTCPIDEDDLWYHPGNIGVGGMNALIYAIIFKRTGTIRYLLEHGADVNLKDSCNRTPLVLAAISGDEDICRLLIDGGCDINLPGGCGETPLHYACIHHHDKIVKLLLTSGSDFNANTSGWTPLHAIFYGKKKFLNDDSISPEPQNHINIFYALLDYGIDLNTRIKYDEALKPRVVIEHVGDSIVFNSEITALHVAVARYLQYDVDPITLELLLEYGADVNILDAEQCSPLYYAVKYNNISLFSFLICYGADVSQRCKTGTPLSAVRGVDGDLPFPRNRDMYMMAIKWKTLGLATILGEDITWLHPDALAFFKTYEDQCKSELDNISNFNSSLYLLLTKPINDIPYLVRHEIMDDIFCKRMEDRFPLYQSIMCLRLRHARFRYSLLQQCKDFSDWLEVSLPDCATLILSYLSNRDLRKLSTW